MKFEKEEVAYSSRVFNELWRAAIDFIILLTLFIFLYVKFNNIPLLFPMAFMLVITLRSIYSIEKNSRFYITSFTLWKDHFEMNYMDRAQTLKFKHKQTDQVRIYLECFAFNSKRTLLIPLEESVPLKEENQYYGLTIKNKSENIKVYQPPISGWRRAELYHIYYEGFKLNEYHYREKNIKTRIFTEYDL